MKKAMAMVMTIVILFTMSGCSFSSNGTDIDIRPLLEIVNSNYNKDEYTIELGDELTTIGIGRGSTIRVKFDSYGARVSFDIRVDLNKVTKDKVVEEMTEFMETILGATGGKVSSVESVSNNTRLKFEIRFDY